MQPAPEQRPSAAEVLSVLPVLGSKRNTRVWVVTGALLVLSAATLPLFFGQPRHGESQVSIRPLTFDPGDEISPSFSPDDSQIVFSWRHENEDKFSLYRTDKFPPIMTPLTSGALAFRQHNEGHTPAPNWPYFLDWAQHWLSR